MNGLCGKPGRPTELTTCLCRGENHLTRLEISTSWTSTGSKPATPHPVLTTGLTHFYRISTETTLLPACKDSRWPQEGPVLSVPREGQLGKESSGSGCLPFHPPPNLSSKGIEEQQTFSQGGSEPRLVKPSHDAALKLHTAAGQAGCLWLAGGAVPPCIRGQEANG